jgi:hypothetical protein
MNLTQIRDFFMWAAIINFCLLMVSVVLQFVLRKLLTQLMGLVFAIDEAQSHTIIAQAIVFQKIVTYVFFVVPFVALWIVSGSGLNP